MKNSCPSLLISAALSLGLTMPSAHAASYSTGTATANFSVSLVLKASCTIAATPLNFGENSGNGNVLATVSATNNLTVSCTNTTPYNVGLDAGTVTGSTLVKRLMAGTTAGNTATTMAFQLYQDADHHSEWGNTQGTDTVAGVGTGTPQTIPVYGAIPKQPAPKPDTYKTTITATVYF